MQNLELWTKMAPEDVIARAVDCFGPSGAGLRLVKRLPLEAHFDSPAGSVVVAARPDPEHHRTVVDVVSREMDRDVDQFRKQIVR